uniref:Complex III subunit VI n=1 Tax=Cucumis sativus TaxID=3659 RepID=A0A0A0L6I2_CUCSA
MGGFHLFGMGSSLTSIITWEQIVGLKAIAFPLVKIARIVASLHVFSIPSIFIFHNVKDYLADEEPVDQKRYLEEACKPKCVKPLLEYQACVKRIQGDDSGHKHCTGQYFDYWSCIDKCVAPKLLTKLK